MSQVESGTVDTEEKLTEIGSEEIRDKVREGYAGTAKAEDGCCGVGVDAVSHAKAIGYSDEQIAAAPADANLGVGCGNPLAYANAAAGETVLDLGSGAGFDAFIAVEAVGPSGRVIGVDMTEEMLERARKNAEAAGRENVEFRKGLIEDMPVDDDSVDVIISNCVINLSPEKQKVMNEAFRVLKPGGRLAVSDIVLGGELPAGLRDSVEAYIGCVAGAAGRDEYLDAMRTAGFQQVEVRDEAKVLPVFLDSAVRDPVLAAAYDALDEADRDRLEDLVVSVKVVARKPV